MKPKLRFQGFHDDWEEKKLGEIVEVQMCKRIFKEQTTSYGEIPFFKIGTLGKAPDAFISKELFEEYKKKYNYPRVGEVMITCSGTVGKSFPYNGYQAYYQDSNIIWLRNDENIVANLFLLYSVKNMTWNTLSSTTIKRIYNKDIYQKKVSYPSLPEQEKIGAFLSQLDDRIEKQEQKIVLLKKRKKGWMQQLFSQTIRFKDENGKDYPAWEEKKLGEVFKIIRNGANIRQFGNLGIPITRIESISKGYLDLNKLGYAEIYDNTYSEFYLTAGDILFSHINSLKHIGKLAYIDKDYKIIHGMNLLLLRSNNYNPKYLFYSLSTDNIKNQYQILAKPAVNQASLSINDLKSIFLLVPSLPEQEKIAEFLSKQDELIEKEEEKLSLLKEQKKGFLQQMFV